MCGIKELPKNKIFKLRVFETFEGFMAMPVKEIGLQKGLYISGRPEELRKKILWLNAGGGYLGVNYRSWPWTKKAMARARRLICRTACLVNLKLQRCNFELSL